MSAEDREALRKLKQHLGGLQAAMQHCPDIHRFAVLDSYVKQTQTEIAQRLKVMNANNSKAWEALQNSIGRS